jgi:hypothetical protein
MPKPMQSCPFLDGGDRRCSNCFQLEHLNRAFKFCFGRYKACPTYLQLQVERRMDFIERAARKAAQDGKNGSQKTIAAADENRGAEVSAIAGAPRG